MSEVVVQPRDDVQTVDVDSDEFEEETTTVLVRRRTQRGMVSAEWAVGLIAAVAIAGVLVTIVTTGQVRAAILQFILRVIRAFATHIGSV